ncbi:conserved hypothetical protein [Hyella patelloides LEGE 07179]|uniref:Uncharacterized protein n=1 Tax=Hyella patelloides LEGE 07179 TaxID=945734 RepID=A0A563VWE8_9CYAN|nr:hypothetical protein [Hyella patelloides]VEP15779.1 conserved hypothetical protein [Hyella patelloides LEGE 07179]
MTQQKQKRKRGIVLTNIGLQKLQAAKQKVEIWENNGDRYTFEELSQRSGLAPITVAKILNRETGVDKQSLILCFSAFGLILSEEDYTKPNPQSLNKNNTPEDFQSHVPPGWFVAGSHPHDYDVRLDNTVAYQGQTSVLIQSKYPQAEGFGTLMQEFKADRYCDRRLQLSGYIKTEAVENWTGLWMRVDGENQVLSFDNMQNRSIKGTTDWTRYSVVLDIPAAGNRIAFGILLVGSGRVWCDLLQFEAVSLDIPTTEVTTSSQLCDRPINLDFEMPTTD